MPLQEITWAVLAAPTRPIPQTVAPVATELSPRPSNRRLISSTQRLASGPPVIHPEKKKKSPLVAHISKPKDTARLPPTESAVRPAKGRLDNVATYCALIAKPANTGLYPSSK